MRKIKFRVWHNIEKRMVDYYKLNLYPCGFWKVGHIGICGEIYDYTSSDTESTLMQYTGFIDKNGKEIYEEDMVTIYDLTLEEHFDGGRGPSIESNHLAQIVFHEGCFKFLIIHSMKYKRDLFTLEEIEELAEGPIEVIGNIYENPELLGD